MSVRENERIEGYCGLCGAPIYSWDREGKNGVCGTCYLKKWNQIIFPRGMAERKKND